MEQYRIFMSSDDVDNFVSAYYTSDQLARLTANCNKPLADYKGEGYRQINKHLRRGLEEKQSVFDIVELNKLLVNYHIPENIIVYRFVDANEYLRLWWNTRLHKEYIYPNFLSTTMLADLYSMNYIKQGRSIVKIYIPKGTPGAYIPEINPFMPEYEILLPYRLSMRRIKCDTYEVVR